MHSSDRIITQHVELSRDGGAANSIGIDLRFALPSAVTQFTVRLPSAIALDSTNGFSVSGSTLRWDSRSSRPSATGRYNPTRTTMGGTQTIDAGRWAVVAQPSGGIHCTWQHRGSEIDFDKQYSLSGTGAISSDGAIAYLGPYESHSTDAPNEAIRLIIPTAAELRHDSNEILECITAASDHLDIGPYNTEVLMIAAPSSESNWGPAGTQFGDAGFWTLDRTQLANPNNTWIHEYVHTRQSFHRDASLRWFIEGTANYFAGREGVRQGRIDFDWFHSFITGTMDAGAVLSDPDTWASYQTKYTKGGIVTTALAAQLRQRSGGRVSLMDILRGLSERATDRQLTNRDLRAVIDREPVGDLSGWLDSYVDGPGLPDVPREPAAFGLAPSDSKATEPTISSEEEETEEEDPEVDPETSEEEEVGIDLETPDPVGDECPVCGAAVDDTDHFCDRCGTAVQRTCFVCGGQAPGQELCPICGTDLVAVCDICGYKQSAEGTYCEKCGTELD